MVPPSDPPQSALSDGKVEREVHSVFNIMYVLPRRQYVPGNSCRDILQKGCCGMHVINITQFLLCNCQAGKMALKVLAR